VSGIKTLSVLENVALVNLEGRGLLGKQLTPVFLEWIRDNDISVSNTARFVRKRNWVSGSCR
jgi:hypothetical protein